MTTFRDLKLFMLVAVTSQYKILEAAIGKDIPLMLMDMICSETKNIAFQSVAMQLGLRLGLVGTAAFEAGAAIIINHKEIGLYKLKTSNKSIYLRPQIQFDPEEMIMLDPDNFETHEKPDPVTNDELLVLGKYNNTKVHQNVDFINKISQIPFELDMDVVANFEGENMPITHKQMLAKYMGEKIYFDWRPDKRGRTYSTGYGLDIQGNKTVRASIQFKNKEVILDIEPLYIALANAMGFDQWTWERRIKWAKKHLATRLVDAFVIPKAAKYPEKYVKTMRAISDFDTGSKSGFMMELDATASGLQIMAALTGCETTANAVNLIDSKKRKDVYKTVANEMSKILGYKVSRDYVKYPVMTHYYNSKAAPKQTFKNAEELDAFYEVLDGLLPGAEDVMETINEQWNPTAKFHSWALPDGHIAHCKTMTQKKGKYTYEGVTIKYMYYVNQGNRTDYRSLAPNMIHSIDGWIVREMIMKADFELVHVHDCFLFHPNHFDKVRELYKEVLSSVTEFYDINTMINSLNGKRYQYPVNKGLSSLIKESSYALS